MAQRNYPSWIDGYADAFYTSFQKHDMQAHMPFNIWNFFPIFADLWIEKLHMAISNFRKSGINVRNVIEELPNHASMKFKLCEIVLSLKAAGTSSEKVKEICDFFIETLQAQTMGDELWLNNRVKAFEDVQEIIKKKGIVSGTREYASEIGKIITGCGTLGHGLYNDFCVDITYDVYGPYDTSTTFGNGSVLVIRSFPDLSPNELWPNHTFPFKSINAYTVYKDLHAYPTYVPCQFVYEENPLDRFTHFSVEIDGKIVTDLQELKSIREKLLETASAFYVEYQALGFERHKELGLWQLCYQLKKLFDLSGVDWRPSKDMVDRVRDKELLRDFTSYNIPREEFYEKFGIDYLKAAYVTD